MLRFAIIALFTAVAQYISNRAHEARQLRALQARAESGDPQAIAMMAALVGYAKRLMARGMSRRDAARRAIVELCNGMNNPHCFFC